MIWASRAVTCRSTLPSRLFRSFSDAASARSLGIRSGRYCQEGGVVGCSQDPEELQATDREGRHVSSSGKSLRSDSLQWIDLCGPPGWQEGSGNAGQGQDQEARDEGNRVQRRHAEELALQQTAE